ncbi:MAG: hypothetical protein ACREP9_06105, partial [Candidatus Dormibacteraceae bacterium]
MQSIWKAGMAGVAAGLLMLACGGGSTTTTPTPTAPSETSSKAADLRTSLDLLLGEHLTLATKATNAALGGRTDEYTAYGQEITDNGQKIGDMMGVAFGDSAKEQFNKIWSAHNGFFVDYTKAVAAKDQAGEDKAVKNLTTQYVPKFTDLIAGATGLPKDTVQSLTTEHVLGTKKVVDDQAAKNWPAAYSDTRAAYLHMQAIGDPIAEAMAKKESDKFPGDASSKAAGFRSTLDMLLQEHLYLATSTTDAALAGRNEEVQGALPAVSANGID